MPRRTRDVPRAVRGRVGRARRAGLARGLVGDRARDRQPAGADARRARATRSRCTRTRPSRSRSSRRCFDWRRPPQRIVLQDLDFPTNHYLFEGFRRYGADVVHRAVGRHRAGADRSLRRRDRRAHARSCRSRSCCSGAAACRTCGRSSRRRIASARRVVLDVYQAAGTVPMDLAGARRRLRGRRLGEVALRRPGRRLSLRAARSDHGPAAGGRRLGGPRRAVRVRDRRDSLRRGASSASRAARRTCRRSIPRAPATRSSPRSACRRFARSRCALTRRLMDAAARARLAAEHADRRRRSAAGRSSSTCRTARASPSALLAAQRHRRLPAERRHPPRAALLQHRGRDRSRRGRDRRQPGPVSRRRRYDRTDHHRSRRRHDGARHRARGRGRRLRDAALRRRPSRSCEGAQRRSTASSRRPSSSARRRAADADAAHGAADRRPPTSRRRSRGADFVIEAAPERIDLKLKLFADIERHAPAARDRRDEHVGAQHHGDGRRRSTRPSRVAGMHFFNPGAQDEARRDRARARVERARRSTTIETCRGRWARRPSSCASRPASSRRASTRRSATKRSTCSWKASRRRATSTRR